MTDFDAKLKAIKRAQESNRQAEERARAEAAKSHAEKVRDATDILSNSARIPVQNSSVIMSANGFSSDVSNIKEENGEVVFTFTLTFGTMVFKRKIGAPGIYVSSSPLQHSGRSRFEDSDAQKINEMVQNWVEENLAG